MGASAVTLPPGFELQPQAPGMGAGVLPGEGAGPGREVAGSRVDPRQAVRQPPDVPQASPGRPQQGPGPVAQAAAPAPAPAQAGGGVPALPPGFELQQPAAAPPRQVGVLETMGRTALAAAIPVVRSIDMAAAGLAGMLAPALGLNPEEEQAKLFKDSEARVARMQQMYAPQDGEQMSRVGQLAGGVLSAPIEMVGGMGAQRGLERSADVVQRGGTVGEAALAGGVTGAANVAANLLPVKAGGVVGRAVENTLGRGLGSRAAQVAGGALTGGTIAAAGDVGVTEASNLALPEGEQFQDLQQEADPLASFGLGAAFGGAAARAERSAGRRAAQAAGQPQDVPATGLRGQPAGSEAPAGSVGAAGADEAMARRERAAALPVPIDLSEGQATRRFEDQQFEREQAKNSETGAPLREHFDEQNERLARNFDQFVDMTGAEQTSTRGVGQVVDKVLREKMDARKAEITKAYDAAREAGDMAEPVPTDKLVAYLNETGPESINAKVLQAVREKLVQLGGAKRDGEGGLTPGQIPINDLEEIRKMINRVSETAPDQHFGSIIKEHIDAITADAGGDLYREARRLRTNYAREFNDRAVVNDLVRNKRGTADRAVALEDVFERSILRRSLDDVRHLRRVLQTAGENGAQAWRELQGQTLRYLQDQALRNASRDQRGNPVVSFAGLNKAVNELDADGRLEFIFGKKGAEQLRDLRDIAADVVTSPPGSVNTSNTGSMLINALDTMVTFGASGVPVPAFAILRKGMQAIRERGVRKRVAQALQQPEGLRQGAPAEAGRFGADDEPGASASTRAETASEPPRSATPGAESASDPRLAEIERLRAATNNPDVHDVLDRRQRKVEAELEAARAQAERAQQAEEIDALARSSTDPEIRRALAARAEKLRGGAIPVGEATELSEVPGPKVTEPRRPLPVGQATELPVEQVRPSEPAAEIPIGDATELPVQRVEPAGQAKALPVGEATELGVDTVRPQAQGDIPAGEATELPVERVENGQRTAAGSDPDADLTMLYKRAGHAEPKRPAQLSRAGSPKAPDTPEFRKWFKGSKVVDETGQPMVVHHGTPAADLQVFDVGRIGAGGRSEGPGFYFTTDRPTAEGYGQRGKTIDVYLNIQKPLAYDAKPFTQAQLRKLLTEIAKVEAKETGGDWRDGYLSNYVDTYSSRSVDDAARQAAGSFGGDETALDQVSGIVGAGVPAATVNAGLTAALGYDGYFSRGFSGKGQKGGAIWVAMRPEQIKSATGNRGTFDPADPNITHKRQPGLPAKPFKARAELESALRAKLGHKLVDGLIKRNVLTMGDAPTDVPRDAQGRFTGNIVELFHDRLDAGTAPGVLMHEVGEHYGMQKMLGERRYAELLEDVRKMRQRPEVAKAWATVKRNYPGVPEGSPVFVSEVAAHLVESAPDRPIVRRMLDAPRAYLYSEFGVNLGRTDPALLRALAVGALRKAAGVEAITPNAASLAAAGSRQQEEAKTE